MNLNAYMNLTHTMAALQKKGFTRTFTMANEQLQCLQTQETYDSSEIQIVEYHRFESDNWHPVNTVIFAIECNDGERGYVVSSEKNMASIRLLKFMDKAKIKPRNKSLASMNPKSESV